MSRNFDLRTETYYSRTDSKIAIKNAFFFDLSVHSSVQSSSVERAGLIREVGPTR
jgi:hypothetical protein